VYYKRICNIAILMASFLVFIVWSIINGIDFSVYNLQGFWAYGINFFISFISAYGFFNLFTSLITKSLHKITWVKRLILGSAYIEGIWIGYYTAPHRHYLCYVIVEQGIDKSTDISGFSFSVDKELKNIWNSDGEVSIDKNSMRFQYVLTSTNDNANYDGFVKYTLHEKRQLKNPCLISGSAFNLETPMKIHAELKKSSHKPINYERETLIAEALAFYNSRITHPNSMQDEITTLVDDTVRVHYSDQPST